MGEYLKMAGVFDFPVKPRHVHDENGYGFKLMLFHSVEAECAAHAINSHDELVAEVERLRVELKNTENQLIEADEEVQELTRHISELM